MAAYGIAEAKAKFSELIERTERGEEVVITRHGKPIVQLRPAAAKAARRASVKELRAALKRQPEQKTPISDDIIAMRRDARY